MGAEGNSGLETSPRAGTAATCQCTGHSDCLGLHRASGRGWAGDWVQVARLPGMRGWAGALA